LAWLGHSGTDTGMNAKKQKNPNDLPNAIGHAPTAASDGVAYESPADARLSSRMFLAYLALTGSAFLLLLADPSAADTWFLQVLADAVGSVFTVVANTSNCSSSTEARRVFVALVVLALHVTVPIALLFPAWRRRRMDDAEPLRRSRMRDLLELVGAPIFFLLLYWGTFFQLGKPIRGAPSYLCWHLGGVWLLFTVQGVMAVAFMCVMVSALRSLIFRLVLKRKNRGR
jgi:hypothetical protein